MDEFSPQVECVVCGGRDYYKEAGHFYCSECQTQTQEIQEHVFEEDNAKINKKVTKRITKKKEKVVDKITSWECYNVILHALTEELVELGADTSLKPVVKCLWMKYLSQIEVFDIHKDNVAPKFSVLNKRDIKLLYGSKKKRRRKSSSESASATSHPSSTKRESSKRKRALALSQQDQLSQKSTQDPSLHNETVTSLRSMESDAAPANVIYNKPSRKLLSKTMNYLHIRKHQRDFDSELKCHKLKYRNLSANFTDSSSHLTHTRLYSILYIGLLIIRDNIQVGDLLRFIREGHLSYHTFSHLFSEEFYHKKLNMPNSYFLLFSSVKFRQHTAKLAKFLQVTADIEVPNLINLSLRYCKELHLPDEIHNCVTNLILISKPRLRLTMKSTTVPNYEARVMSFIIFTLKLLFGLDGVTEYKFSEYATLLNEKTLSVRMFDIMQWIKFIGYRDSVVTKYHFPTAFERDPQNVDPDLFLEYVETQKINVNDNIPKRIPSEMQDYLQILKELKEMQINYKDPMEFTPSMMPFKHYLYLILNHKNTDANHNILTQNFTNDSLDFLLRPNKFLTLLNNKKIHNSGANHNIVFDKIINPPTDNCAIRRDHDKCVKIDTTRKCRDHLLDKVLNKNVRETKLTTDIAEHLAEWQKLYSHYFKINELKLESASESIEIENLFNSDTKSTEYEDHYNPFERYWMNTHSHINSLNAHDGDLHLDTLPHTFNVILKECSRIIEQNKLDLLAEFHLTETYLAYIETYRKRGVCVNYIAPGPMTNIIKQAKDSW